MKTALRSAAAAILVAGAGAQTQLYTHSGTADYQHTGFAVALLPDLDADGVSEYAVGSPFEAPAGVVRIRSGRTSAVLRTISGSTPGAEFGASIAAVGDLDGHGLPDLLVGAPGSTWQYSDQGAAYRCSSETGMYLGWFFGSMPGQRLGSVVANVGDVNGDGEPDYAVASPDSSLNGPAECGSVQIFSGATTQSLALVYGTTSGERFGSSVAGGGDFNHDGRSEWLVGAPGFSGSSSRQGKVEVRGGVTGSLLLATTLGTQSNERLGSSVAVLGDTDGDGQVEYACGGPGYVANNKTVGRAVWFEGLGNLLQHEVLGSNGWQLGASLARLDWDGDGDDELAIGAPGYVFIGYGSYGSVRIHDIGTGALQSSLMGFSDDGRFGAALASGVDFNADGADELLVGAPDETSGGVQRGAARLLLGGTPVPARYGTAKVNSTGCTPAIGYSGAPSSTLGGGLHVTATNVLPNKSGMLFWGLASSSTPFHGGTLLVAPPLIRTAAQVSGGSALCSGHYDFHFSQAYMAASGLSGGTTVYAQYWSRDPGFAHPDNVGLTNALRFTVAN